ncbi:bifunctional folylpolyglutamate synthase/dihydrofolate synthase [Candidatus Woesearchaeota archaeon]|nr:bifunctional folylpolyglutamate synthase/dihydrofolate synthase [Candidatus Woesearchaeota archaeon]
MSSPELDYLYSLDHGAMKFGLERMRALMEVLNYPYRRFPSIHVAGTNGKGSTCAFLASILQHAGYKVGLNTSPHLVTFNERIQINGVRISDSDLALLIREVRQKVEEEKIDITYFEFTTALAFLYFAREQVDIAIIEVGMGGRLDATNVIRPLVSVITNIDLEHTKILGDSKVKIAHEKAGIIKEGVPVVTAEKDQSVLAVFSDRCKERGSVLYETSSRVTINPASSTLDSQMFKVSGGFNGTFLTQMRGTHQLDNIATALAALSLLPRKEWDITPKAIEEGLKLAYWPGRLEVISQNPFILIDGAHNLACVKVLLQYLKTIKYQHGVLLLALSDDAEKEAIIPLLIPHFQHVILTQGNHKPRNPQELLPLVQKYCKDVEVVAVVTDAVVKALAKQGDFVLVTGSLYMIGEAMVELRKRVQ